MKARLQTLPVSEAINSPEAPAAAHRAALTAEVDVKNRRRAFD